MSSGSTVIRVTGSDGSWSGVLSDCEGCPGRFDVSTSDTGLAEVLGDVMTSKRETFLRTGMVGTSGSWITASSGFWSGDGARIGMGWIGGNISLAFRSLSSLKIDQVC